MSLREMATGSRPPALTRNNPALTMKIKASRQTQHGGETDAVWSPSRHLLWERVVCVCCCAFSPCLLTPRLDGIISMMLAVYINAHTAINHQDFRHYYWLLSLMIRFMHVHEWIEESTNCIILKLLWINSEFYYCIIMNQGFDYEILLLWEG